MSDRAIAINVAANTSLPGFRGPLFPDGSFTYLPIPERKPTTDPVPTYGELDVNASIPEDLEETPVHLDPSFAEYPHCRDYTYGDEHGVKAGPLSELTAGDWLFFYATLTPHGTGHPDEYPADWCPALIGHFRLADDPVVDAHEHGLSRENCQQFASNAHVKRSNLDARVLLRGNPDESCLYDTAIPLSAPSGGADPGHLIHEATTDSGRGPWWRRPLRIPDPALIRSPVAAANSGVNSP